MPMLVYHLLDVFTEVPFGGNQLAVFPHGEGTSAEVMQRIARELNLSETAFILPPQSADNHYRLRIFTPGMELPFAGHPTIGTGFLLYHLGEVVAGDVRLEEGVGPITVTITPQASQRTRVTMQQPVPQFGEVLADRATIANMLSLTLDDLIAHLPVQVVSSGVPFVYVPVRSLSAMGRIRVRLDIWEQTLQGTATPHLFAFTPEVQMPGSTVHSRMFAPAMGIPEDPATGAASGPLGCYLVKHGLVSGSPALIVSEQGIEMGRPSFVHIQIDHSDGAFSRVRVGGQSVYIGEGVIEI